MQIRKSAQWVAGLWLCGSGLCWAAHPAEWATADTLWLYARTQSQEREALAVGQLRIPTATLMNAVHMLDDLIHGFDHQGYFWELYAEDWLEPEPVLEPVDLAALQEGVAGLETALSEAEIADAIAQRTLIHAQRRLQMQQAVAKQAQQDAAAAEPEVREQVEDTRREQAADPAPTTPAAARPVPPAQAADDPTAAAASTRATLATEADTARSDAAATRNGEVRTSTITDDRAVTQAADRAETAEERLAAAQTALDDAAAAAERTGAALVEARTALEAAQVALADAEALALETEAAKTEEPTAVLPSRAETIAAWKASVNRRILLALADELAPLRKSTDLPRLGVHPNAPWAFYERNGWPVLRLMGGSAEALQTLMGKLERAAGSAFAKRGDARNPFWLVGAGDWQVAVGRQREHLVLAAVPFGASQAVLDAQLSRPQHSWGEQSLRALNRTHGYNGYASGFIDLGRLLSRRWLDSHVDPERTPEMEAVCKTEVETLFGQMPRLNVGYTRTDLQAVEFRAVLDLSPGWAADLQTLKAAARRVTDTTSEFGMGMALNPPALVKLLQKRTQAVVDAPWQCPDLVHFNDAARELQPSLAMLGMSLQGLQGVSFSADRLDWSEGDSSMPGVEGALAFSTDLPDLLIGAMATVMPELAQAASAAQDAPQRAPVPADAGLGELWVQRGADWIALANGAEAKTRLTQVANLQPQSPAPLLSLEVAAQTFKRLVAWTYTQEPPRSATVQQRTNAALTEIEQELRRITLEVHPVAQGLELRTSTSLRARQ